jgi:hypothetical protein
MTIARGETQGFTGLRNAGHRKRRSTMRIELRNDERQVIRHALEDYLSNLREEIVKTEKHEWRTALHNEEDVLKRVIERLS